MLVVSIFIFSCDYRSKGFVKGQFVENLQVGLKGSVGESNAVSKSVYLNPVLIHDSVSYVWEYISQNSLPEWEYSFCDNKGCYFLLPERSHLNMLVSGSPKSDRRLKLTVIHNKKIGKGNMVFKVYDVKNSEVADTVVFNISIY